MSIRVREKIALLVFMALLVVGSAALVWYLSVGTTWNRVATGIDDATSQMDGYVVVLYEGTVPPIDESLANDEAAAASDKGSETPDQSLPNSGSGNGDSGQDQDPSSGQALAGAVDVGEPDLNLNSNLDSDLSLNPDPKLTLDEIEESYREKGADTFVLEVLDPGHYRDGIILKRGSQRFGVLSVSPQDYYLSIEERLAYLAKHEVNYTIVLTPDGTYVENYEGIDIVLTTENSQTFTMGETREGIFYVNTPQIDTVGAILVSPHYTVSSKTIHEL